MSYLNFPQLHFFGQFRADPSTLNNTPDNYNPNNQFPPANGEEVSNNIQLYWNPNGTAEFALDCVVGKICYADGTIAKTSAEDPLVGMSVRSMPSEPGPLDSAKVVDLDPMQQNVTEVWGLSVAVGASAKSAVIQGRFLPAAYTNAWVQVYQGRGDYAGSAKFQSILDAVGLCDSGVDSRFIRELREAAKQQGKDFSALSFSFVLRAFNPASTQYLVSEDTLQLMTSKGIPAAATTALEPLSKLMQGRLGPHANPGQIPTTSYFTKLVKQRTANLGLSDAQVDTIIAAARMGEQPPPLTEYEFTYGQAFGTLGLNGLPSIAQPEPGPGFGPPPPFLCPDRIMTPEAVLSTNTTPPVPTDSSGYTAYFAPFKVTSYLNSSAPAGTEARSGAEEAPLTFISLDLGNALLSTKPASADASNIAVDTYKDLYLYAFGTANKVVSAIEYRDNALFSESAGIVNLPVEAADVELVQTQPLGLVNLDVNGKPATTFLIENVNGYYLRANQFVYRMNPGVTAHSKPLSRQPCALPALEVNPETATVEFFVSCFGKPATGVELWVEPMAPIEAQIYSNNTLGTGGTTGMVNLSVPDSALTLFNADQLTTNEHGVATLQLRASDPGNPRGYMDGQIYFLKYGFKETSIQSTYVQSPDDLVSVQVYNQQPDIKDITWSNFVGPILEQYGKIYPVMSFQNLGNEQCVKASAKTIRDALTRCRDDGALMPVTRDLSYGRLDLILKWLDQQIADD